MAADTLINDFELPFQLYDVLGTENLTEHAKFAEHSRETFDAVLDTANKIATQLFLPHNHIADKNEPQFDGKKVSMISDVKVAFDAFRESGFIAGRYSFEDGGMQLPETVMTAVAGYFMAANPSTTAYPFLTTAAINVISHFASDEIKAAFMPRMLTGEFTGTMALTEPHAGSSLADIKTTAVKQDDGSYRVKGSKIYISGGDHELSDNIVHLVLAKVPGGPGGVKGISLFAVPKYRLNEDASVGERNDVHLTGLIHKLGYRGTTSTALSFGDEGECYGYLIGEEHFGLRYMFKMMNEARIAVGFGASMVGYRGYQYSLDYAKDRTQGRIAPNNKPEDAATAIINHGDVKRMLLAQKAYSEGGISLCLYGSNLIDRINTCEDEILKNELTELLDLLTPVLKAWPSEYGPKANDLGIQVLGGAGYTREYQAEQFWRDNRLNPIHEGTNGVQALDLSFRKLWQKGGLGIQILKREITKDLESITTPESAQLAGKLMPYMGQLHEVLVHLGKVLQTEEALTLTGNAQALMNIFASIVLSWIWIRQASKAEQLLSTTQDVEQQNFYKGKIQAAKYFIDWELPLVKRDIELLTNTNSVCTDMQADWF
ncbi:MULTISPECIES: acyl-CoA dehydrogenase [unclassified Psychrobacter]|uniref:acyl-CoA dehydrogenase n=1 Tax=unclassified Psychrobacter TaxID=196806 RepID=UPI0025B53159|nr:MULTISPECIES: acyl-CoA dehydrogenase [unclassified Psychrobacter]MDN3452901.1 acyl-CoA dehydrogenase [Psychrobacter sp. APC 3350]MDN3502077.1 acyl-CoA dehydrogenase [Psychrobacter sp. 5A.1]